MTPSQVSADGVLPVHTQLAALIEKKQAVIGVIGLGYVGLPLVRAFTTAGFRCLGFDVDQTKVDKLRAGQSYIKHIDSSALAQLIRDKKFEPTADMSRLSRSRLHHHLRSDAAQREPRSRPELHRRDRARDRQDAAPGTTRRAGKHDPSNDDTRRRAADPRGDGADVRDRLLSGVQSRTRRSRQSAFPGREHPEGRRRIR